MCFSFVGFFFFQAEDGIRDWSVTGVQTCALPIYPNTNSGVSARTAGLADQLVRSIRLTLLALLGAVGCLLLIACVNVANLLIARGAKIGRASCRERV